MSQATEAAATEPLWTDQTPAGELPAPEAPGPRKRRWLWLLLPLALAAGTAGYLMWRPGSAAKVTYETAAATRGRIVVTVTASGTVSALKTVQVGSQVSGRVAALNADFNDTVKQGQLLARIDTQLFEAAVEQARASNAVARANVAKAEAQLLDAQKQLGRSKVLGDQKYLSQQDVDTAASAVAVARAQLGAARAQQQQSAAALHQAELNLSMTAIRSPIDGVVVSRSVDVGQTVAASLQAPTIFTLAEDLRKMQVETHVGESDVAKLAPGMPVDFTVDAFTGRKFVGRLRQVRNAAETVQNVVTYDAIVDVDNPNLELRPGMTATVSFIVADKSDVVRIPNTALRFHPPREAAARPAAAGQRPARPARPDGAARPADRKLVYTVDGNSLRPLPIRIGVTDGTTTELVEGAVSEGTALVTDSSETPAAKSQPAQPAGPMGAAGPMGIPGVGGGGRRGR
jgi:HlyD family secretion protein